MDILSGLSVCERRKQYRTCKESDETNPDDSFQRKTVFYVFQEAGPHKGGIIYRSRSLFQWLDQDESGQSATLV